VVLPPWRRHPTSRPITSRDLYLPLIERRLGTGRGVGLYLTGAGQQMAEEAVARQQAVNTRLRQLLGAERAGALTELLRESHAILRETR
jgi:hypothetical protein